MPRAALVARRGWGESLSRNRGKPSAKVFFCTRGLWVGGMQHSCIKPLNQRTQMLPLLRRDVLGRACRRRLAERVTRRIFGWSIKRAEHFAARWVR